MQPQPSRVLIIEDSVTFAAMLQAGIEDAHGLTVDIAKTLAEARDWVQASPGKYMVAIVDLHLPDSPNGEAAHYMVNTGIPTVVFTGSVSSNAAKLWEMGIADYVHKGARNSVAYVISTIGRYLANRHIGILVIDDMSTMCQHISQTLGLQNFRVFCVTNGSDAKKTLAEQPSIKIALVDHYLKEGDGIDITSDLVELKQGELFEIIGMSVGEFSTRFLKAGASDFLAKPFSNEELLCRISRSADRIDSYAHLRNLNELKNHFLSMAAHDLRNPISAIKSAAKQLHKPTLAAARREQALAMIDDNCDATLHLLESLLDIGTIESGQLTLDLRPTDINALIEQRLNVLRELAALKDITLSTRFGEAIKVNIDPMKFGQVIDNLLSNAIKYSPKKSQVQVRVEPSSTMVRIQIIDSGAGVSEDEQAQLFQPFCTLSTKATNGERQTGLGLAIVKAIVDAHGGEIFFKRTQDGRSRFVVTAAVV